MPVPSQARQQRCHKRRSAICSRAHQVSPGSAAEQIEQQRLSIFDAEQQKLDQQLDKSLNICRC
jgi:hypothetical protein